MSSNPYIDSFGYVYTFRLFPSSGCEISLSLRGRISLCAPEFRLVGARMRALNTTRLGSVHLPGDVRRTHVRMSRHLPFYDPKIKGRQVTRV
ncbi:hypothetical protein CRG98_029908 [Punica granatum]|uniref:Uncharacterized protein n=1 Tax=Punica granatum TaxID=22663 RepID=A0A2I0J0W6_PUNGR|nr:hypothetical protein CRG98_029908 [Punica granatum]